MCILILLESTLLVQWKRTLRGSLVILYFFSSFEVLVSKHSKVVYNKHDKSWWVQFSKDGKTWRESFTDDGDARQALSHKLRQQKGTLSKHGIAPDESFFNVTFNFDESNIDLIKGFLVYC